MLFDISLFTVEKLEEALRGKPNTEAIQTVTAWRYTIEAEEKKAELRESLSDEEADTVDRNIAVATALQDDAVRKDWQSLGATLKNSEVGFNND